MKSSLISHKTEISANRQRHAYLVTLGPVLGAIAAR